MAFKRTGFNSLKSTKNESFATKYKFSKKVPKFEAGHDVYALFLGLEDGFYETPIHKVITHEVDGQTIGFKGAGFPVQIKCKGVDAEGNQTECLCCTLASKERTRFPEDYAKRVIGGRSIRITIPILILSNSLNDESKKSYPVTKVAMSKDLLSSAGLKFSYIEMAQSTFVNDIVNALGKQLKEDGDLDYELDEQSDEYFETIIKKLSNCVVKIHGVSKQGFSAALKEYSFFDFSDPKIAKDSGEKEQKLITNYKKSAKVMEQVDEFMKVFDVEVDNLFNDWTEKDLKEYYNSALGKDLKEEISTSTPVDTKEPEKVVVIATPEEDPFPVTENASPEASDEDVDALLNDPFADTVADTAKVDKALANVETAEEDDLNDFEFDSDDEEDFFG